MQELQVTNGELVEPDVLSLVDARQGGDVVDAVVLCLDQVVDAGTRSDDALGEVVHTETLERAGVEMAVEHLVGIVLGEDPVVEQGEEMLAAEQFDEIAPFVALHQHF